MAADRETQADYDPVAAGLRAKLLAGALLVIAISALLWLFRVGHGRDALEDLSQQPLGWPGALLFVALSAPLHEGLHALGWRALERLPGAAVAIRPSFRGLGLAAVLRAPVRPRTFRVGLALPGLVLGVLPALLGILAGSGLGLFWGLFLLFESYQDLVILLALALRGVPEGARIRSHARELGYELRRSQAGA